MAEIINLNKARKNKKREDKEIRAELHRVIFGRKKSDKNLSAAKKNKQDKDLSDHKIDDQSPE